MKELENKSTEEENLWFLSKKLKLNLTQRTIDGLYAMSKKEICHPIRKTYNSDRYLYLVFCFALSLMAISRCYAYIPNPYPYRVSDLEIFKTLKKTEKAAELLKSVQIEAANSNYEDVTKEIEKGNEKLGFIISAKTEYKEKTYRFSFTAGFQDGTFDTAVSLGDIKEAVDLFDTNYPPSELLGIKFSLKDLYIRIFYREAFQFQCEFEFSSKFNYLSLVYVMVSPENDRVGEYASRLAGIEEFIKKLESEERSVSMLERAKFFQPFRIDSSSIDYWVPAWRCSIYYDPEKKYLDYHYNTYLYEMTEFPEIQIMLKNETVKEFITSAQRNPKDIYSEKIYTRGNPQLGWNIIVENTRTGKRIEVFVKGVNVRILK